MNKENKNVLMIGLLVVMIVLLSTYIVYNQFGKDDNVNENQPVIDNNNNNNNNSNNVESDNNDIYEDNKEDNKENHDDTITIYEYIDSDNVVRYVTVEKITEFDVNEYTEKIYKLKDIYNDMEYSIEEVEDSFIYENSMDTNISIDTIFGNGILIEDYNDNYGILDYKTENVLIPFEYENIYCYDPSIDSSILYENNPISYCKAKKGTKYDLYQYNSDTNQLKKLDIRVDELYKIWQNEYMYASIDSKFVAMDVKTGKIIATTDDFYTDYDNKCSSLEKEWIAFEKDNSYIMYEYDGSSNFKITENEGKRCN